MNKKLILGIVIIIAAVVIFFLVIPKTKIDVIETSPEVIKIGAVLSLTGAASIDGESIKNGIEIARKELEAKGLDVEVVYYDDHTDPKQTAGSVQLAKTQNVQAIIGPTWSFLGDAAAPICESADIVCFEPANTSEYSTPNKNVFFGSSKLVDFRGVLSGFLKENKIQKVVEISNVGAWYVANSAINSTSMQDAGVQLVFSEQIDFGVDASTVTTMLSKVKKESVDTIILNLDDDKAIYSFLTKASQFGVKRIIAESTSIRRVIKNQNIPLNEYSIEVFSLVPKPNDLFNQKYQEEYGLVPGPYADTAYDGLNLLVEGILTKQEDEYLKDYLKRTEYIGVAKTYKFDDRNDVVGGVWGIVRE